MKKLFKNSFFSFFKNKLAISLLMIIVFLTTATFTMFNSATHAFKKSYDQVMTEGNRHDYTIKELYNIEGDVVFNNPVVAQDASGNPIQEHETTFSVKTGSSDAVTYNGESYVVVDAAAKVTLLDMMANQFVGDTPLLIKAGDAANIDSQSSFKLYIPKTVKDGGFFGPAPEIATTRADIAQLSELVEVQFNSEVAKSKISIPQSSGAVELTSFDFDAFKGKIKTAFQNGIDSQNVTYQKYVFDIDKTKSGAAFSTLKVVPYSFTSKLEATGPVTNWDTFTSKIRANLNGEAVTSLNDFKEKASLSLLAEARTAKHNDLLNEIKNRPEIAYKDVKSIEISTAASNIYKVVEDESSFVDKINIYSGRELSEPTSHNDLVAKFATEITRQFPVVGVSGFEQSSNQAAQDELNKMIANPDSIFDNGWSVFATSSARTIRVVDPKSLEAIVSPTFASQRNIKALTSSEINKIYSDDKLMGMLNDSRYSFIDIKSRLESLVPNASQNIVNIGTTPFIVVGIGITPDFAFPIISQQHPIPDTNSQAIIYTNKAGFSRIKSAYQSAQTENYIAIGKSQNASNDEYQFALFNDDATKGKIGLVHTSAYTSISWPSNINAIEKYNSKDESILLAPSRITFLEKLNHTISSVSWIVTSLLVLFTAFIVSLVIKKQIDGRKKQLGILLANGYSKLEIASSMMIIGLIVAVIPSFLGYLTGHFMQFGLMNIFSNYWTLPIWHTQFSWLTLIVTVVAPLAGMGALAFLISMWALRGRIPEILAGESAKSGFITRNAMRPMKYFGIKTKMGMSLVFSNVGKLSIAFVAFAASIIAMSVSMNSVGKFDYARDKSEEATNYEYQVDLVTPTVEGGLYSAQTLSSLYRDINGSGNIVNYWDAQKNQPSEEMVNKVITPFTKLMPDSTTHLKPADFNNYPTIHVASVEDDTYSGANTIAKMQNPSMNDGDFAYYPYYLKNRIQLKSLLDLDIQKGINPWKIASQMMPENQRNSADIADAEFIDFSAKYLKEIHPEIFSAILQPDGFVPTPGGYKQFLVKYEKHDAVTSKVETTYKIDAGAFSLAFTTEYRQMIAYGLAKVTHDYEELRARQNKDNNFSNNTDLHLPFFMTYNQVLTDNGDEKYTYIDSSFFLKDIFGNTERREEKVRGIDINKLKSHTSQISMSDASISALENFLPSANKGVVPVVVNKYFTEKYGVNIGSEFEADLDNSVFRKLDQSSLHKITYKVVGVENTFNEGKVYTLQNYANDAIGLSDSKVNSASLKSSDLFNGVFTRYNDALIFKSAPLYSLSGVYPGKNQIKASVTSDDGYRAVNYSLFTPAPSSTAIPFAAVNPKVKTIQDWIITYGDKETQSISPMQAMYSTVDWTQVSDYQFNSIMHLSSTLMNTVQAIVMFIALAFVLLISTMVIADNKRFIATLKVMGYRTKEISKIFLATFIPSLVLALIVSIPLSFGILEAVRVGIMGFGHVLIPLYLVGWEIAAAFAVLVVGFLAMYFLSLRGMKNTSLLQAFQE